jgi:hypothetical protein
MLTLQDHLHSLVHGKSLVKEAVIDGWMDDG